MKEWYFTQDALDKYDTAQRNDTIEECARVAEEYLGLSPVNYGVAAAIRALKDKP